MAPIVPAVLMEILANALSIMGADKDLAPRLLSTWEGWPIAINTCNYVAKSVPAMKKSAYTFKGEMVKLAIAAKPEGMAFDPTDKCLLWEVELPGRPQLSFHGISTTGTEHLPVSTWKGTRWQNEEGVKTLLDGWKKKFE